MATRVGRKRNRDPSLNDAVIQLARNATKVPEQMIADPVSENVERSTSPNDLQPRLDCSQTRNHSSQTHVELPSMIDKQPAR